MRTTTTARLALAAGLRLAPLAAAQDVQRFHDKGFWSAQLQAVGDAAQAATGVRIVETPYSTAEQCKAFVQSSIASGETPAMFTWWTGSTFRELVETGQVAPLDDLWATMLESGANQPGAAELFTVDGHPYGVPMVLARWVVALRQGRLRRGRHHRAPRHLGRADRRRRRAQGGGPHAVPRHRAGGLARLHLVPGDDAQDRPRGLPRLARRHRRLRQRAGAPRLRDLVTDIRRRLLLGPPSPSRR